MEKKQKIIFSGYIGQWKRTNPLCQRLRNDKPIKSKDKLIELLDIFWPPPPPCATFVFRYVRFWTKLCSATAFRTRH